MYALPTQRPHFHQLHSNSAINSSHERDDDIDKVRSRAQLTNCAPRRPIIHHRNAFLYEGIFSSSYCSDLQPFTIIPSSGFINIGHLTFTSGLPMAICLAYSIRGTMTADFCYY